MVKKKEKDGFEEHFKKLEILSEELQEDRISIDQLIPRMKEALDSIKICKSVLKETKSQLEQINSEFKNVSSEEDSVA